MGNFFKKLVFNLRKRRAIRKADTLAREQRRKFLVLVYRGKPIVVSMQQIKLLIRQKKLHRSTDFYRDVALYTAMPAAKQ